MVVTSIVLKQRAPWPWGSRFNGLGRVYLGGAKDGGVDLGLFLEVAYEQPSTVKRDWSIDESSYGLRGIVVGSSDSRPGAAFSTLSEALRIPTRSRAPRSLDPESLIPLK